MCSVRESRKEKARRSHKFCHQIFADAAVSIGLLKLTVLFILNEA